MKKHHYLYLILLTFFHLPAQGQSVPFNFVMPPTLVQNNLVVSNFDRFSGRLGLNIPLYSYKSPSSNLALNVALNYSGGGTNLVQNTSAIGLGWSLDAGGMIYRSINNLPDDKMNIGTNSPSLGYFYGSSYIPDNPCCVDYQHPGVYDEPQNKTHLDSEEDDYYFNFNGRQGKLSIPQDILSTGSLVSIKTIPQSNCKIYFSEGSFPNVSTAIGEIVIVDETGIEYHFGAIETMQRKSSTTTSDGNNNFHYTYTYPNEYFVTAWRITKMLDPNTQEEIDFSYEDYTVSYQTPAYETIFNNTTRNSTSNYFDSQDYFKGTSKRLTSISFKNGDLIQFIYDSKQRIDFISDKALVQVMANSAIAGNQLTFNLQQSFLTEVPVTETTYQVVETPLPNATPGAQDQPGAWLMLKGVTRLSTDGASSLTQAKFGYNRQSGIETNVSVPQRFMYFELDSWGYPNRDWLRDFGTLDTVYDINGGYTYYQHEFNDFRNTDGSSGVIAGVRIKNITQSDGINHANDITTSYIYQLPDGTSSGFTLPLPPNTYTNAEVHYPSTTPENYTVTLGYNISYVVQPYLIQSSPVAYSRVVESIPNTGKTEYLFSSFSDYPALFTALNYPFPSKPIIADWAYGLPKKISMYDNNGNVVRTTQNTYKVVITTLNQPAYRSMKMAYRTEADAYVFGSDCAATAAAWNFTYEFYYPVTGLTQLTQTTVMDYHPDGRVTTGTTQYNYDPTYLVPTKTTAYNSKGEKVESIPFYLFQSTDSTSTPHMYAAIYNLLTSPYGNISLLTKTDGTKYITSYGKMIYHVTNGMLKPQQSLSAKLAAPVSIDPAKTSFTPDENYGAVTTALSVDGTYDQFDATGNLVQASVISGNLSKSSIWDNTLQKQIAQSNAPYGQIDYTSFENNYLGGWTCTMPTFNSGGVTGASSFTGTLNKTVSSGNYTLTLWTFNNGSATVNGTTGALLLTSGSNQLWSWALNNTTNIQVVGTRIDELRLYPQGAQMSTCTYKPLVGISSSCDANNKLTYYEYDIFGRLKDIRDQDGNIVKTMEYHLKGQ
jgi:YD repeat-containing protein